MSGSSPMKAALNGVPSLSILDGWWAEGCDHGKNGWAIGSPYSCDEMQAQNHCTSFRRMRSFPSVMLTGKNGHNLMRASIKTGVRFTAPRMINEYQDKFYKYQTQEVLNKSQ